MRGEFVLHRPVAAAGPVFGRRDLASGGWQPGLLLIASQWPGRLGRVYLSPVSAASVLSEAGKPQAGSEGSLQA